MIGREKANLRIAPAGRLRNRQPELRSRYILKRTPAR